MILSKTAKSISPSMIFVLKKKAQEFKKKGKVISFGAGEPDFDTPLQIKNAAIKALKSGFTKYTAVSGIKELKTAIIKKFKKDNGLNYKPEEIIVSTGGKQVLFNAIFALVSPQDEVIIPAPFWVSYPEMVKAVGGKPVFAKTTNFKLTPATFLKAITPKTKLLILNSPSNPTGAVYSKKELENLKSIILKNKLFVISDEIYEKILYDGTKHVGIASLGREIKKRTIVVNGVSKTYAMTGWRIGYGGGPKEIISAMSSIQSHTTSNPCSFAQKGAVEAILGNQTKVKAMVQSFSKRRKLMLKLLAEIKGVKIIPPQGAFYVFLDISKFTNDSVSFALSFLEKEQVVVIPGKPFGAEGYIRLSFPIKEEDIKEGIKRLKRFLKS